MEQTRKLRNIISISVVELFITLLFFLLYFAFYNVYSKETPFLMFISPTVIIHIITMVILPIAFLEKRKEKYTSVVALSLITLMLIQEMFFIFFWS